MEKSSSSGRNPAVDAFLEYVGQCLARRWLERQRGDLPSESLANETVTPTSKPASTKSKGKARSDRRRPNE